MSEFCCSEYHEKDVQKPLQDPGVYVPHGRNGEFKQPRQRRQRQRQEKKQKQKQRQSR